MPIESSRRLSCNFFRSAEYTPHITPASHVCTSPGSSCETTTALTGGAGAGALAAFPPAELADAAGRSGRGPPTQLSQRPCTTTARIAFPPCLIGGRRPAAQTICTAKQSMWPRTALYTHGSETLGRTTWSRYVGRATVSYLPNASADNFTLGHGQIISNGAELRPNTRWMQEFTRMYYDQYYDEPTGQGLKVEVPYIYTLAKGKPGLFQV